MNRFDWQHNLRGFKREWENLGLVTGGVSYFWNVGHFNSHEGEEMQWTFVKLVMKQLSAKGLEYTHLKIVCLF